MSDASWSLRETLSAAFPMPEDQASFSFRGDVREILNVLREEHDDSGLAGTPARRGANGGGAG